MVLDADVYVIARNARHRPTLQHLLKKKTSKITRCGHDVQLWSRAYSYEAIEPLLCLNCAKLISAEVAA